MWIHYQRKFTHTHYEPTSPREVLPGPKLSVDTLGVRISPGLSCSRSSEDRMFNANVVYLLEYMILERPGLDCRSCRIVLKWQPDSGEG